MTKVELPTIERVAVDWYQGYANSPALYAKVDEAWDFPSPHETWDHWIINSDDRGDLYFGTRDHWAHFVYVPENQISRHPGGCTGNLKRKGGTPLRVRNGWSSAADCVNLYLPDEDHIVEITLIGGEKYTMGRAGLSIRKDALGDLLPDGIHLIRETLRGPHYVPSLDPLKVVKPKGERQSVRTALHL